MLARRSTVCDGYANLFCALATRVGLTAEKITGDARGLDFAPAISSPAGNHAWNAVLLQGRWQLLDATWGAGHVLEQHFVREFEPFYFLTPPEQFICSHFPHDPHWQLLATPVSRATFEQWPELKATFFKCRLHLDSHPSDQLTATDAVKITLTADAPTEVQVQLKCGERELPREACFTQREGERYAVYARFPAPGAYQLVIFARAASAPREAKFQDACSYRLTATAGSAAPLLPKQYGAFVEHNVRLIQPWDGALSAGTTVLFELTVPGATHVALIVHGSTWVQMTRVSDDHFQQQLQLTPGAILIGAQFDASNVYASLLEYTVP